MFRFFENLVDPYTPYDEQDHPPQKLWPFLWVYSQPFKRLYAYAAGMSFVVAAVEIFLIFYLGRVVNLMSNGEPAQVWRDHGWELIGMALFLLFLRPALQAIDTLLLNNAILPNLGTLIRWRAHKHVLRQSIGWFENDFAGRIANRIMQTPPAAGDAVFQIFDALAYASAYLIGAFILLSQADLRLAVPLVIWFTLFAALVQWTVERVAPAAQAASDARSEVTGRVVDAYSNIHSVKMFSQQGQELDYARESIEKTRKTFMREMRIFSRMDVSLTLINGFLIVGVVGWSIGLWMQGFAEVGTVAAATALTLRLMAMTGWIMWAMTSFFRNLGVVSEGMQTIAQPIDMVDAPGAAPLELRNGGVELDKVTHHYGRQRGGLRDLSLSIKPGEKVGIVGRSGAGKSTLVKLLLRFYDAEGGQIRIDGQDIKDVTQDSVRSAIGMVSQDTALLHRSIRDNILYGRPGASDAEMIAATKQAEAMEFIENLKDSDGMSGFDALVGERGVKLSGGQRQRIALARVILKNAPILVLDEATSALDSEVEATIQKTLSGVMEGKTVIAIAHRLSTISHMDRIVVLDEGRIVEEGSHNALLAQDGLYAQFWARQSGGFIGTEAAE